MDTKKEEEKTQNNNNNIPKLKPIEPEAKLKNNEIGIKSNIKGFDIKKLIDKIIYLLIIKKLPNIILKSRGKGIQKLISIQDILRRKVLGLYVIQKTYSNSYINENDNNKQIKLPCLDIILWIEEPPNKNEGFFSPLPLEDLDKNYIDPKNPINFQMQLNNQRGRNNFRGRYRPGFRGRGNNFFNKRGNNNYFQRRNNNNYNYNNNLMKYNYNNNYNQRRYNNYNNNNRYNNNYNYNYNNNNYILRRRGFKRRGRFRGNNREGFKREDEDYKEFKSENK